MSVSKDVVILTRAELEAIQHQWFQKGVRRGRFEEAWDTAHPQDRKQITESGLVILARDPAPNGDGTTVGNEELGTRLGGVIKRGVIYRDDEPFVREAARRLSAPAVDVAVFAEAMAKWCDGRVEMLGGYASGVCLAYERAAYRAAADHIRLSAPAPRVGDDEREEMRRILDAWAAGNYNSDMASEDALIDRLTAAGYRKLAPAQSVGQSAAQGVGEVLGELVKWLEDRKLTDFKNPYHAVTTITAHVRRLSPESQDDEG